MEQYASFITQNKNIILLISLWEVAWKSVALWKSAKKDQKVWFAAILLINAIGLVPIAYLIIEKVTGQKQV